MRVLVTGANGQLGSEIRELKDNYPNWEFFFTDVQDLDITNPEDVLAYGKAQNINAIINCAAYTAVDKAEEDRDTAALINETGALNLARMAEDQNAFMIHISTDYVFDGTAHVPYAENHPVAPQGVYGETKLAGEQAVVNTTSNAIVIRTSWLYSTFCNNFVKTMMRLGKERDQLGVIFDQVGTPTYARDLAKACLDILSNGKAEKQENPVYHFSNEGVASWYDFATAIMELGGIECKVKPIGTADYPTPAKRPHYSVLDKGKIKKDFGVEVSYWREALKICISKLN